VNEQDGTQQRKKEDSITRLDEDTGAIGLWWIQSSPQQEATLISKSRWTSSRLLNIFYVFWFWLIIEPASKDIHCFVRFPKHQNVLFFEGVACHL
jgi:hypothetical protein